VLLLSFALYAGSAAAQTEAGGSPGVYRINAGDVLVIDVFDESDLSGEFPVEAGGAISFPLVGELGVAGLTAAEVEEEVADSLRGRYLASPRVTVNIIINQHVIVSGWVEEPGTYDFRPRMTIRSFIAEAGGFHPRAVRDHVVLRRRAEDGSVERWEVEVEDFVKPGDMVLVPDAIPCYQCGRVDAPDHIGMYYGGLAWYPELNIELGATDNLFRERDASVNTGFTYVTPSLTANGDVNDALHYAFGYSAAIKRYFSSSDDNHEDQFLNARTRYQVGPDADIEVRFSLTDDHELRGEGLTEGEALTVDEPIPRQTTEYGATGRYGFTGRGLAVELDLSASERRYDAFPDLTAVRERDVDRVRMSASYDLTPSVDAVAELIHSDVDFLLLNDDDLSQDSEQTRWSVGVSWDALAKTTGELKIGEISKDFDAAEFGSISEPAWEVALVWEPRTYSTLRVGHRRTITEGARANDTFTLLDASELSWSYDLNDRLTSRALLGRNDAQVTGETSRDVVTYVADLSLRYTYSSRISIRGRYRYADQDSNVTEFNHTRNLMSVQMQWQF